MSSPDFHTFDDLPGVQDPRTAKAARQRVLARHTLASLRHARGKTQTDVAKKRGVTKAAVHQLENRPFGKISVGSLVGYFQALGYEVDEAWIAQTLSQALQETSPT